MSTFGNTGIQPPAAPPPPPVAPVGPPQVDMTASAEMQAWLRRLQIEDRRIGLRNLCLAVALSAALPLLAGVLCGVYWAAVGPYAEIDDIQVEQHPVSQGRLQVRFRVASPGRVYCRRTSGPVVTDVIDHFHAPCEVDRPWSWGFRPGENIELTVWYRRGLMRRSYTQSFPTSGQADIVMLIDTTGSMDPSIAALKEKCVAFAEKLEQQALKYRFALIGFGDVNEGPWLDKHEFTADVQQFREWVSKIQRFDGGDLPESALDALDEALALPFDADAIRYFYLVTDASYHDPGRSEQITAESIAARLREKRVILRVFSRPQVEADYARLFGDTGRFDEIENFGRVLSEGRILED